MWANSGAQDLTEHVFEMLRNYPSLISLKSIAVFYPLECNLTVRIRNSVKSNADRCVVMGFISQTLTHFFVLNFK